MFLILLQVILLCFGASYSAEENKSSHHKVKRQTATAVWNGGPFTQCNAVCGGGVRVRSVRCLTRDGIISQDCENRPRSWEFCNTINCDTFLPNADIRPSAGNYTLREGTTQFLFEYTPVSANNYSVMLITTESDGTITTLNEMEPSLGTQPRVSITGPSYDFNFTKIGGIAIFSVIGEISLSLHDLQRTIVNDTMSVVYQNSEVSIMDGDTLGTNIASFVIFDGIRFYHFNKQLMDPFSASGIVFVSPQERVALFSTNLDLNIMIIISSVDAANRLTTRLMEVTSRPMEVTSRPMEVISTASQPDPLGESSAVGIPSLTFVSPIYLCCSLCLFPLHLRT